jgi:hypothetical protein
VKTFEIDEPVHIEAVWGPPLSPGMTLLTVRYTPDWAKPEDRRSSKSSGRGDLRDDGFPRGGNARRRGRNRSVCAQLERFFA